VTAVLGTLAWSASLEAQDTGSMSGMQMDQTMQQHMMTPDLMMPTMDAMRGRKLFASKGCVVCHSVNGVGGGDAAPLDASTMKGMTNPFDFVANMWRGAGPMIELQQTELGAQIEFTGQDLADIIAFLHHASEQKKFSEADISATIRDAMKRMEDQDEGGTANMKGMGNMNMKPEGSKDSQQ
jgi:cytochrome c